MGKGVNEMNAYLICIRSGYKPENILKNNGGKLISVMYSKHNYYIFETKLTQEEVEKLPMVCDNALQL